VVEVGVLLFFVLLPVGVAWQSGRPVALLLPAALLLVSLQWVVVSDGDGLAGVGLAASVLGLLLALAALRVRGRRRRGTV
jgi:hypothetical protein